MDILGHQKIYSYDEEKGGVVEKTSGDIRKSPAVRVHNFLDLASKIAELQYKNTESVLLFRGQARDHRNKDGFTSLKPSILRDRTSSITNIDSQEAINRFEKLYNAEELLIEEFSIQKIPGLDRLKRHKIVRWAILQHYEICHTPLLDLTSSLRIAASFGGENDEKESFIFVLGFPNISGAVTVSADAGIQIVRLASVCPPKAIRPHIQEGYLAGEYPDLDSSGIRRNFNIAETDFGRRLIAKFIFNPDEFWESSGSFPRIAKSALYPAGKNDIILAVADKIKSNMRN